MKKLLSILLIAGFVLSLAPMSVSAQDGDKAIFKGAYPYQVPPQGHFNTFVTDGITVGIYSDLFQLPLARYMWADGTWWPVVATEWKIDGEEFVLSVRDDATWSNGEPLTAADVVTTFKIGKLQGWSAFNYVDEVYAIDEYTVGFHMFNPSSVMDRFILTTDIRSDAVYGEWAEKAQALFDEGLTSEDEAWQDLIREFNEFRPEELVASGPYIFGVEDITDSRLVMHLNESSVFADTVNFDEVWLYNGETPTITPIVMSGDVHYATHGFPPATEMAFIEEGVRILRPPIYSGPALYFNFALERAPYFSDPEFRQALAYAINRDENGFVSLGESGKAVQNMAGFSDNLLPVWMTQEQIDALEGYGYNPDKAVEMLEAMGFSKGDDGVWVDPDGERLSFELTFPAEYADWSGAAQNLTDQLNAFGVEITARGVTHTEHPTNIYDGDFELAIRNWGTGNPHPSYSYREDLIRYNTNGQNDGRPGMSFPLVQEVNGEEVDLEQLWSDSAAGVDVDAQKQTVADLAAAYNYLLPQIPLWERYGNNPAFPGLTWPPDDDPVYLNSPYGDSFVVIMILDGRLALEE